MATTVYILSLLLLFLLTLCSAQTPPAPEPVAADGPSSPANCLVVMLNVSDCLAYVKVGSNETKPEPACCSEFAGMAQSSPECVCNLVGGGASPRFGVKLDKLRALELSSICGVEVPASSLCSVMGFPTISPTGSEDSSSAGSEGSEKDKKNGSMTTKECRTAYDFLMFLGLTLFFTTFSLF